MRNVLMGQNGSPVLIFMVWLIMAKAKLWPLLNAKIVDTKLTKVTIWRYTIMMCTAMNQRNPFIVTSARLKQLKRHVNWHIRIYTKRCKSCDFKCHGLTKLIRHKITRHNFKSALMCNQCDYCAPQSSDLKRHLRNMHMKQQLGYDCNQYSSLFRQINKFQLPKAIKHNKESNEQRKL